MSNNRRLLPLIITLLFGSMVLAGCDGKNDKQSAHQPTPTVDVVTLKNTTLDITTDLPGRTSPFRIAEVRPQVGGIILKRHFVEGSDIAAGVSLYQIDPATYQAAYESAKGDLAKAVASADITRVTVNRYKPLLNTSYISKQDYDTAVANLSQAEASVVAAKAAVETARINLAYTKVTSPISGRIGRSAVTEGALVTTTQTNALATVQQLDPMYVDLTQSSNDYLRLKQELTNGTLKQENGKAQVSLLLDNGSLYTQTGTLEFSDVTVDQSTGSITLRAIFPNPDHTLLPGMFVRARLDEGTNHQALLVPQQAVTRTPRGEAVTMVVGADNKVEQRTITTSEARGNQWLVTQGLTAGERVVVSGLQKIKPGVVVKAQEAIDKAPVGQSAPSANSKS